MEACTLYLLDAMLCAPPEMPPDIILTQKQASKPKEESTNFDDFLPQWDPQSLWKIPVD